jgi:hypothetical protein
VYSLKWPNALERRIRAECRRDGSNLPADLVNPPALQLGLALYLNAWFELHEERGTTTDAKGRAHEDYLTRRQCFDYAIFYEFDTAQTEDLWYYVSAMDRGYMTYRKSLVPQRVKGE